MASLYEALANRRGYSPRQTDELHLWEIAVLLGRHRGDEDKDDDKDGKSRPGKVRGRALLWQRWKHHKGEGPPATPEPVSAEQLESLRL